jgi:hypothetical protein
MLCENIHRIMNDKKVSQKYKTFVQEYIDRLTDVLDVVTLQFSDGSYSIERSRLIPFGVLWGLTQNYNENELESVVIPRSRDNFLVLLSFIETETPARRARVYHDHNTRLVGSLLEDATYFRVSSTYLAELSSLMKPEN